MYFNIYLLTSMGDISISNTKKSANRGSLSIKGTWKNYKKKILMCGQIQTVRRVIQMTE